MLRRWLRRGPDLGKRLSAAIRGPDDFRTLLDRTSAHNPRARLVLVAEGRPPEFYQRLLADIPHPDVTVISDIESIDDSYVGRSSRHVGSISRWKIDQTLKAIGPVDVIVDATRGTVLPRSRIWTRTFLHLRPMGKYIIYVPNPHASTAVQEDSQYLRRRLILAMESPSQRGPIDKAVKSVEEVGDWLVITKQGTHHVNIRDREVDAALLTRGSQVSSEVLAKLPERRYTARAEISHHGSEGPLAAMPSEILVPTLNLRHYSGRVAWGKAALFDESCILPETFRHHLKPQLRHRFIKAAGAFSVVPADLNPSGELPGQYYYLDSEFTGHFGHVATDIVSRLWGWDQAKARFPEVKALLHQKHSHGMRPELESQFFEAFGIERSDIVWSTRPAYLESLIGATPLWHHAEPYYVHPELTSIWRRISDNLIVSGAPTAEKVFISRSPQYTHRSCRNLPRVEELFIEYGFTVVYPETLPLGHQASMFQNARVVAGLAGSGMFNMFHCRALEQVIVLSHESYDARNEFLFGAVLGGKFDFFWSPSDITHPADRWSLQAYISPWEFSFERNEVALRRLLAQC